MKKRTVTVKAVYMEEIEVEGCDVDEAYRNALSEFKPCSDTLFSIDVLGLSPWTPDSHEEDILRDEYVQRELDNS